MEYSYAKYADNLIKHYGLRKKSTSEYGDAPCPNCGGTDRFWISNFNGRLLHHCRKECDFRERHDQIVKTGLLSSAELSVSKIQSLYESDKPYHEKKRIDLHESAAVCDGGTVIVELCDIQTGEFRGRQYISSDGSKKFSPGLTKAGVGAYIGEATDPIYVTEGWADAVVVHRATGKQALFALDVSNLVKTVAQLKEMGRTVIVAADNDEVGIKAAKACSAPFVVPSTGKDWWDVYDVHGYSGVAEQLKNVGVAPALRLFDHVADIKIEPPKWLIDKILPQYAMAALVAPSYTGKSFLAVDMACSIATGHSWHKEFSVTQGSVFYVIGEGRFGVRRRVQAWHRDRGIALNKESTNLHFSRQGLNFRDANSITSIKADLHLVDDVKLIIIDTLARSFGGGNENAPQDMGQFIQGCDDLMHEFNATILVVHHFAKDTQSGPRGHNSFFGALDTSMTLKKLGQHDLQLICDKQKDGREFDKLQFTFVTIGGDGETPVLHMVPTSKAPTGPKLGKNEQLALDTYAEATKGDPQICRLHLEKWRSYFARRHTGDTSKQKNDAFSRARRNLVSRGLIDVDNDFYMLSDKATSGVIHENVAGRNGRAGDATDTPL